MKFNGVKAVKPWAAKSVLATGASSKLPWGEKHYFSREQFEADLKRIDAFYHDRGYPDARVTSFDVKLSDDQNSVEHHAQHLRRASRSSSSASMFEGFEPLPADHRAGARDAGCRSRPGSRSIGR